MIDAISKPLILITKTSTPSQNDFCNIGLVQLQMKYIDISFVIGPYLHWTYQTVM